MIRKTPKGYVLLSKTTGKKLGGPYKTREQALKRVANIRQRGRRDPRGDLSWHALRHARVGMDRHT